MKQIVVVADMKVGKAEDVLVTHALGSCLGVMVHDPVAKVGGLLHVMLPLSKINRQKAENNPFMFVDTGLPALFRELYDMGGKRNFFVVKLAGCATPLGKNEPFNIGERNLMVCKKLLYKNSIPVQSESTGGTFSRTVYFDITSGEVDVAIGGKTSSI